MAAGLRLTGQQQGLRNAALLIFVLPILLFSVDANAQSTVELGLERDVNRYRWTAGADVREGFGDWQIRASNRFTSDAYVLFTDSFLIRDENRLDWAASRRVTGDLSLRVGGRTDWFSLSRVFIHSTLAGVEYRVTDRLMINPMVGVAVDQRPGVAQSGVQAPLRADVGPALGIRSTYTENAPDQSYALRVDVDGNVQRIRPRRGHFARVTAGGERDIEGSRISGRLIASTVRRDTYEAVSFLNRDLSGTDLSESIEQTSTDTLGLGVEAAIPLGRSINLAFVGDLTTNGRTVRNTGNPDETLFFDTEFDRRSFDFQGSLVREKQKSRLEISTTGGVEEESRSLTNRDDLPPVQATQKSDLLQQADYDRGFFSLASSARVNFGRRVVGTATGSARILSHNTPEANPDDRDEVSFASRAGLQIRLSEHLTSELNFYGTRYETVYLKAERSAENNVQRSIRFTPGVTWRPDLRTTIRLSSEVRATYTVDEFTLPGRRPRDQSARELRYDLDTRRTISDGLAVIVEGSYSTLHLGRFLEEEFAEIPFDTLRTQKVWLRLQTGRQYLFDVGLRTFVRSDYNQNTTVSYQPVDENGEPSIDPEGNPILATIARPGRNIIRQIGPTAVMVWPMNNRSSLRLDGWLIFQRVFQRLYGDLPEANADQIRRAARKGRLVTIPNLSLSMRWRI